VLFQVLSIYTSNTVYSVWLLDPRKILRHFDDVTADHVTFSVSRYTASDFRDLFLPNSFSRRRLFRTVTSQCGALRVNIVFFGAV